MPETIDEVAGDFVQHRMAWLQPRNQANAVDPVNVWPGTEAGKGLEAVDLDAHLPGESLQALALGVDIRWPAKRIPSQPRGHAMQQRKALGIIVHGRQPRQLREAPGQRRERTTRPPLRRDRRFDATGDGNIMTATPTPGMALHAGAPAAPRPVEKIRLGRRIGPVHRRGIDAGREQGRQRVKRRASVVGVDRDLPALGDVARHSDAATVGWAVGGTLGRTARGTGGMHGSGEMHGSGRFGGKVGDGSHTDYLYSITVPMTRLGSLTMPPCPGKRSRHPVGRGRPRVDTASIRRHRLIPAAHLDTPLGLRSLYVYCVHI